MGEAKQPLATAPKDGTMVWLLVEYDQDTGWHPLADADRAWTIDFNNFINDEIDEWRFAGWSWSQDCFTQGEGRPVAWKPLGFDLEAAE